MIKRFGMLVVAPLVAAAWLTGCAAREGDDGRDAGEDIDYSTLDPVTVIYEASKKFGELPDVMSSSKHPVSDAKVTLGRQLFYDKRLSKNQDLACNSCHDLSMYGVDRHSGANASTSLGHRGQKGTRNAPSVYNAALHIAQFWDGRAVDVEEQAKGPVLNPIEMAMKDGPTVVKVLKSIPGYAPLFSAAFPGVADPITYDNMGIAIGAFERKLVTPDRFDRYMNGEMGALTKPEIDGFLVFMHAGCPTCHAGPGVGGAAYKKLGALKMYKTDDVGRFAVTKKEADRYFFKVPSLRNVEKTAPYFHDGSQPTLPDAVRFMSEYQTVNGKLSDAEINQVVTFLKSLTGELPKSYITEPAMLPNGPNTPAPDPN
jgi:cytochrome c peroxidase